MALRPDEDADVSFEIPTGDVHLTRRKKHKRYTQIRRAGSFGWTLGPDNLLTQKIENHLTTDLAGSVAVQLIGRASLTWEMAADVKILHEPDDVESLKPTPDLKRAAGEMADAFRAEIDPHVITAEARQRLDGPFLYRSAYAVHIGRETKDAPNQQERCFGRLAPLGRSNLKIVVPWLGYVPARALTDWISFDFMGWPVTESRRFEIQHPHRDLWLQPEFCAQDEVTAFVAVTEEIRASTEASDSAPMVEIACKDILSCPPLRCVFAPGLKLVVPGAEDRAVERPLPFADPELLKEALSNLGHPQEADSVGTGWWTLFPLSPSRFVYRLPDSKGLLHALLWMAAEESDFPLDPWIYTDVEDRGLPPGGMTSSTTSSMRRDLPVRWPKSLRIPCRARSRRTPPGGRWGAAGGSPGFSLRNWNPFWTSTRPGAMSSPTCGNPSYSSADGWSGWSRVTSDR